MQMLPLRHYRLDLLENNLSVSGVWFITMKILLDILRWILQIPSLSLDYNYNIQQLECKLCSFRLMNKAWTILVPYRNMQNKDSVLKPVSSLIMKEECDFGEECDCNKMCNAEDWVLLRCGSVFLNWCFLWFREHCSLQNSGKQKYTDIVSHPRRPGS